MTAVAREVALARCVPTEPAAPAAHGVDPAPTAPTAPPAEETVPPGCGHAGQVLDVLTSGEVSRKHKCRRLPQGIDATAIFAFAH